jgi:hypothetical protein
VEDKPNGEDCGHGLEVGSSLEKRIFCVGGSDVSATV